jgi:hypothetical protein
MKILLALCSLLTLCYSSGSHLPPSVIHANDSPSFWFSMKIIFSDPFVCMFVAFFFITVFVCAFISSCLPSEGKVLRRMEKMRTNTLK